jgi:hypothetical protein
MSSEIAAFIEHARGKGMDHATIRILLLSSGWREKDVVEALAKTTLDMPIPAPPDTGGAREAFLHLLATAAFYASVAAVLILLFLCVERLLPDPSVSRVYVDWDLTSIRWSLAIVLVAFPAYVLLSRTLLRDMRAHPERSWSGTRRWLTYLTLLLAALALGGDLISLLYRFLEGGLSSRFGLKVAIVFGIAGLSFAYHLLALRSPIGRPETARMHRGFALIATGIVAGCVAWGFSVAGSPEAERVRRLDEKRIADLRAIRDEIVQQCLGNSRHLPSDRRKVERPLPPTLEELVANARYRRPDIKDPETTETYRYEVLGDSRFRLGARFNLVRDEAREPLWNHPADWKWFEFDLLEG